MAGSQAKDPYEALGIARDADDDTIRSAYRQLARELHPDVNPDNPSAEERFKTVTEAYSVLSDPEKRKAYDEFGEVSFQAGFDAAEARRAREAFGGGFGGHSDFGGRGFGFGGLEDMVSELFGRGAGGHGTLRRRGVNLEADLQLDFLEAVRGGEQRFQISRPTADGGRRTETVTARIPAGVADGGRIRLRGKGGEGSGGAPSGDLMARIRIRPHPLFRRDDRDITLEVPVTIAEATLGTKVEVPTLDGRVTVTIPPGTDSGSKLRLPGKGVPHPSGGPAGHFFVSVKICVPRELDDAQAAQLSDLAGANPKELRATLDED